MLYHNICINLVSFFKVGTFTTKDFSSVAVHNMKMCLNFKVLTLLTYKCVYLYYKIIQDYKRQIDIVVVSFPLTLLLSKPSTDFRTLSYKLNLQLLLLKFYHIVQVICKAFSLKSSQHRSHFLRIHFTVCMFIERGSE